MAASPSFDRAQRLPRDFAWITAAIAAAQFIVNMTVLLLPTSPHSEQMRSVYAQPGVWIPLLSRVAAVWLLAATLAWCHARKALDERGAARIARLRSPASRFAAVFLAATLVNALALTPLFYRAQVLFMPGGPLHGHVDVYGLRSIMAMSRLGQSVIQMLVLIASVWLAAWWALRERGAAVEEESSGVAGAGAESTRRAVALVIAAMFVSLQMWIGHVASGWFDTSRDSDLMLLLLGWFGVPLAVYALAYWGAWLGAAPAPAQAHPFRAVAAAVSAVALLQAVCIALAIGGLLWMASVGYSGRSSSGNLVNFAIAMAAVYLVVPVLLAVLVVLVRAITRRFYRRYL
ncbi:hypothetical protein QFZ42_005361 [Variovorax paradoxus]|uniref:hypothetical protein n=1 Tax=Variovorax paradoxus TaxID=34073 RepID=UPI00279281C0|nr:hypothetical protein [Variovorax paradoxus]MDQ0573527.1 hypothetical protein [Variovorax paradoxus]